MESGKANSFKSPAEAKHESWLRPLLTPLDTARRYLPPAICWAFPTRHVSRISNVNGYIFSKTVKRTIVPLGRSNPRAIAIPIASWLSETDDGNLKELLLPYPADQMRMWEFSPRVNSPKNDDPSLWYQLIASCFAVSAPDAVHPASRFNLSGKRRMARAGSGIAKHKSPDCKRSDGSQFLRSMVNCFTNTALRLKTRVRSQSEVAKTVNLGRTPIGFSSPSSSAAGCWRSNGW